MEGSGKLYSDWQANARVASDVCQGREDGVCSSGSVLDALVKLSNHVNPSLSETPYLPPFENNMGSHTCRSKDLQVVFGDQRTDYTTASPFKRTISNFLLSLSWYNISSTYPLQSVSRRERSYQQCSLSARLIHPLWSCIFSFQAVD